jgi:beta-glucosidase
MTYDHKWLDEAAEILEPDYRYLYEFDPQYPFGFGLSYTSF